MTQTFEDMLAMAFSLSDAVRWVAVGVPNEAPRWAYRPGIVPLNEDRSDEAQERFVNPAILTLAKARGDWDLEGLRYIVIAYGTLNQVVAALPGGGHVSLSIEKSADAVAIGEVLHSRFLQI